MKLVKKLLITLILTFFISCDNSSKETSLTIYSGRKSSLSSWIFEKFEKETGIKIKAKFARTSDLVNLILSEKKNSPADLIYAQDASSLALLEDKNFLTKIETQKLNNVYPYYFSKAHYWVGVSGRLRALVYNKNKVNEEELPQSILELANSNWYGQAAWAPENSSFQSHIAYMISQLGKEKVLDWLKNMKENDTKVYPKNTPIVEAVMKGEVSLGLVNHYYLYNIKKKTNKGEKTYNYIFPQKDAGAFTNISGLAILKFTKKKDLAEKFITFLLKKETQKMIQEKNFEYPVTKDFSKDLTLEDLKPIKPKPVNFKKIGNLAEVYELLKEAKILSF